MLVFPKAKSVGKPDFMEYVLVIHLLGCKIKCNNWEVMRQFSDIHQFLHNLHHYLGHDVSEKNGAKLHPSFPKASGNSYQWQLLYPRQIFKLKLWYHHTEIILYYNFLKLFFLLYWCIDPYKYRRISYHQPQFSMLFMEWFLKIYVTLWWLNIVPYTYIHHIVKYQWYTLRNKVTSMFTKLTLFHVP